MRSLCTVLCRHSVLALPGFTKPFQTESDAFDTALGGVFTQENASAHKPIAFLSKILTISEKNYSGQDFELLAIITCCKAWRPNTDSQHTVVIIDHKPLIYLYTLT